VKRWKGLLVILGCLACGSDRPAALDRPDLGIAVTFPGTPQAARFVTPTPFGEMEWFSHTWQRPGRMDEDFHTAVGNLPPGDRGGTTPEAILQTYEGWMRQRWGGLERTNLSLDRGPGFRYRVVGPNRRHLEGIVVVRRGRLHVAEVTVPQASDPRVAAFLGSFVVR